jgi:tetratricopeptide (TPR) repeat protein
MNAVEVCAIANYWKARCHRKKGDYASALLHTRRAREFQSQCGHVNNEAAMRVLEGLVLLSSGELEGAAKTLREAETVLLGTDDYGSLGNIQSTYGRILERQGRYGQAIEHYAKAIEQYQKRDLKHTNVARAVVDMSFTQIQVAREIRQNIDAHVASRQKNKSIGVRATNGDHLLRDELERLHDEILKNLDRARLIYKQHPNARGLARVHLYRGYLYLDMDNLVIPDEEARKSYGISEPKHDLILMASARNLQCMAENIKVEEEVGGCAKHALAALDHARDAIDLATKTEDRRLLAIVYTWYGLTLLNKYFNDHRQAREAMDRAAAYLEAGVRDHIWNDFQMLRRKLLESTTLDAKLLHWAHGELGDKTFRQLAEDFADLVIPRAWDQEERKISRVAARLSISPAKVRRVLGRLGYLESGRQDDEGSVTGMSDHTYEMAGKVQAIAVSRNRRRRTVRRHSKIRS